MKEVRYLIRIVAGSLLVLLVSSFQADNYKSLDLSDPIGFNGKSIVYGSREITLGPKAFFIDGQLSDAEVATYKYVFNSINEAAKHLTDGTDEDPMVLYIAPYVYWIDDPDDPEIRIPREGESTPFGLEIECNWLKFEGLSQNPENVVLACNRGQTMGAKGNFTMFKIIGDGLSAENVTFGNYCNIDLNYELKPELNRKMRGSAFVQAQLVACRGDKILARNTHFISRLNLLPFYGGERTLFDRCHFESTDDALAPKGLYLNCTFEFYASKPFGHTAGTGAVLLNCDIRSYTRGEQYLVKGRGQVAAINCRMIGEEVTYWGWRHTPLLESKYYHFNNSLNGENVEIGYHHPYASIDVSTKKLLKAYVFNHKGHEVYNTYNLLRGDDDWDPMEIKQLVEEAGEETGVDLTNLPTQLKISPSRKKIETGKDSIILKAEINRFGGYIVKGEAIEWYVSPEHNSFVDLQVNENGTCTVIPTNSNDETCEVIVNAKTSSGLEAASVLYVTPKILEAPEFITFPTIVSKGNGKLYADYKLNMTYPDQSLVTWYRCSDASGKDPIEVAVSRFDEPKLEYQLTQDDVGYYVMVTAAPKHLRCNPGDIAMSINRGKVAKEDIFTHNKLLKVDLKSLSTKYQPRVIPGFWTIDCNKPDDTFEYNDWDADTTSNSWYYGRGENGASNDTGLVQATKGARLRYTPVDACPGDMRIKFTACPAKTAGQGFSSAKAQYMDIFIKFDTQSLNGYALRLVRTTKYHNAIDCQLMKYVNGNASPISSTVSTSCYRTPCYITIEVRGNKLIAHMETSSEYYIDPKQPELALSVDLETEIETNSFGGFGIQHTGSVRSGATLIKDLILEWE